MRNERQRKARLDLLFLEEPFAHQVSVDVEDNKEDYVLAHEDDVQCDRDHLNYYTCDHNVFLEYSSARQGPVGEQLFICLEIL